MFGMTDVVGRAALRAASYATACLMALFVGTAAAQAETRNLKFFNLHTKEKEEISYKRNGRYLPDGLKKINWMLRDWRKKQPTNMDPRLLDLVWEAYRQSGSRSYIQVICGYRSASTNGMLRSRSSGVAKESQHVLGKALDFTLPDVSLAKLRAIGLKMQVGGVGYYPKSGSPFVHFDIGNVRHWPKMSRRELMAVFPNGKTLHVPSDGKPLPGYEQALASYKSRKSSSSIQVANAGASPASGGGGKTLLSMLFGGGADEEEDTAEAALPKSVKPAPAARMPAAKPEPVKQEPAAVAATVPSAKPKLEPGVALPIRDNFDTTAPRSPVPNADVPASAAEDAVTVAALDASRVPLPSAAPMREQVEAVVAAVKVPVPTAPADRPMPAGEALVAALETAPPPAEIAAAEAGQLAYAVPRPRNRPPFESILRNETPAADAVDEIRAITEAAAIEMPVAAPASVRAEPAPVPAAGRVRLASLQAPAKPIVRQPPVVVAAKPKAVPVGKTARFKRPAAPAGVFASAKPAPTARPVHMSQAAIADRIGLADFGAPAADDKTAPSRTGARLVRKAPTALPALAAGFVPAMQPD